MIVYVPVGNGPLRRAIVAAGHGQIVSAECFRWPTLKSRWILDNGAYTYFKRGQRFHESMPTFETLISAITKRQRCDWPEWCVCPDIVADPGSLEMSLYWRKHLPDALRWYLAVQDGMCERDVRRAFEYVKFDGIFVGGSSAWKNEYACRWVGFAHGLGVPCHIGRVNGPRRLQWAVDIGADSIDGTGWTRAPFWLEHLQNVPEPSRFMWGD